jgi:hypothetical protein
LLSDNWARWLLHRSEDAEDEGGVDAGKHQLLEARGIRKQTLPRSPKLMIRNRCNLAFIPCRFANQESPIPENRQRPE